MKEDIAMALAQPFAPEQIKRRKGPKGISLDYIEAHAVIARLNDALGGDWSFEVVEHHVYEESNEVVVLGRLTVHTDPVVLSKMAVGCQDIKRRDDGGIISLGNDPKAAASDALKKCATLLGVGLHLYDKDARRAAGNGYGHRAAGPQGDDRDEVPDHAGGNGNQVRNGGRVNGTNGGNGSGVHHGLNGDGPLTVNQMKAIFRIAKGRGMHNRAIAELVNARFGKPKAISVQVRDSGDAGV